MQPDKQGFFKDTQQLAEDYIKERLFLMKLEAAEKSARLATVVGTGIIIGVFFTLVLLLLSALGCYLFQQLTNSWFYGIGIVILFYFALIALLVIYRKVLFQKYISDFVIGLFFQKTEDSDI